MLMVAKVVPVVAQVLLPEEDRKLYVTGSINYTEEDFRWSIAGNLEGQNPDILSEIIWKDLRGPAMQIGVSWNAWNRLFVQARFSSAFIVSGTAADTDYQDDNRANPSFSADLKSNRGNTNENSAGLGYKIVSGGRYQLNAVVGYGLNRQSLLLSDTYDDIEADQRLQSTYRTRWEGPFINIASGFYITKIRISHRLSYHQVNYTSSADWNLVEQFQHPVSFRHTARGYGLNTKLELQYKVTSVFSAYLSGDYNYWATGSGIDRLYLVNGDTPVTRFNGAIRRGIGYGVGVALHL